MKSEREVVTGELHQIACELNALPKASEMKPLADRMFRAIANLSASVPGEAVADWTNRSTDDLAGWINELATLAEHPTQMSAFVRHAMRTICLGLYRHAENPTPAVSASVLLSDAEREALEIWEDRSRAVGQAKLTADGRSIATLCAALRRLESGRRSKGPLVSEDDSGIGMIPTVHCKGGTVRNIGGLMRCSVCNTSYGPALSPPPLEPRP